MKFVFALREKVRLERYLTGKDDTGVSSLYKRLGARGEVLRMMKDDGRSMIVKVTICKTVKSRIKNVLQISNSWREWRIHNKLYTLDIPVPEPLWFGDILLSDGTKYEVIVMEDLGKSEPVGHYLNALRLEQQDNLIASTEDTVISLTEKIISLGFVDIDNHLRNFLISADGRMVRIDFEVAYRPMFLALAKKKYLQMMARLVESHVYAMQPETERTVAFVKKLCDEMKMDSKMQRVVEKQVNVRLAKQSKGSGKTHSISFV